MWWDNNKAITPEQFDALLADFLAHAEGKTLFAQDLYGGADPKYRIKARVFTELAWHSLFIRTLLIRPERAELAELRAGADDRRPAVASRPTRNATACAVRDRGRHRLHPQDRADRRHVLCRRDEEVGVHHAQLSICPAKGVMPMHCSANVGRDGDAAMFFGLSGTGKTTLSADPNRTLIGDDEHGWGRDGIFNFEGGCYAKTHQAVGAKPSRRSTPPRKRFGTVLENVVLDPITRVPDFDDGSKTENTRSRLSARLHPECLARPAAPAIRRTSSC